MTDRELLQMALEALTRIWEDGLENYPVWAHEAAIDNLRERLAQPEQKPMHPELRKMWEDYFDKCFRAQPEQEPVFECPHGMVDTCCSNPLDCYLNQSIVSGS